PGSLVRVDPIPVVQPADEAGSHRERDVHRLVARAEGADETFEIGAVARDEDRDVPGDRGVYREVHEVAAHETESRRFLRLLGGLAAPRGGAIVIRLADPLPHGEAA